MRLGAIEFDPSSGELRRDNRVVRLEPQPAAVLTLLASRPGDLVTHHELRHALWGDTVHVNVADSLHYCIRQIRLAAGDTGRNSHFIETIPRRGYRLIAPVGPGPTGAASGSRRSWPVWAAAAAAVLALGVILEQRPNRHHEVAVGIARTVHDLIY